MRENIYSHDERCVPIKTYITHNRAKVMLLTNILKNNLHQFINRSIEANGVS